MSKIRLILPIRCYIRGQHRPDYYSFAQFYSYFGDYNPHSSLFNPDALKELSFADQIKVFHTGFAMWQQNLMNVKKWLI